MSSTPSPMEELRAIHDAQRDLMERLVRAIARRRGEPMRDDADHCGGGGPTNRTATP